MRVALVHDDLVQWGGAERVFLNLCEFFPSADIYTSVVDNKNFLIKEKLGDRKVFTSFLQKIPGWRFFYKALLPLYPLAFEQFDFSGYDLVVSHTTRFAKVVITKPETIHICYCHTPPRFLWNFSGENVSYFLSPYLKILRNFDRVASKRVDYWVAGSKNAQNRIKEVYGVDSIICYPPVDDIFFQSEKSFDGDYYLIISRLTSYKKVDVAVKLFNRLNKRLVVVGAGPQANILRASANSNIEFYENISNDLLINLISGSKALIVLAEEDFGLTPIEAQAMGKPVIAYKKGGSLETVIDNKTGLFFTEQNEKSLEGAIEQFDKMVFKKEDLVENAKKFNKDRFKKDILTISASQVS